MPIYGQRPDDVVTDSRGNVLRGIAIKLYATQSAAEAGTTPLGTVLTDAYGLWEFESEQLDIWALLPNGRVWQVAQSNEGLVAAAEAAQAEAATAAGLAQDASNQATAARVAAEAAVEGLLPADEAAATYATIASVSGKLDAATAASTYATVTALADKLDADDAAGTYATISGVSTALSGKLDSATAAGTYQTIAAAASALAGKVSKGELVFNAADYGSNGAAIQSALDAANTAGGGIVLVPDTGTWNLPSSLIIYAGTVLWAAPTTSIVSTGASPLMLNGTASASGYAGQGNITVTGGTWDCGGASAPAATVRTGFAFAHARGVTVRDLTIKDVGSGHGVELNAIDGALVENVRFDGFYNTNSRDDTEAVQLDCARGGNFPWFGANDGTVCKNVTITNNWVGNTGAGSLWWRGFGSHNTVVDVPYTGVVVTNNHIRTRSTGVRAYNWSGFTIANNTCEGGGIWVQSTEVARTGDTLNLAGVQTSASAAVGDGTITGNTIRPDGLTMQYHGIWLSGEATGKVTRVTVAGNVVAGTNNTQHGIRAATAASVSITGNVISGTAAQAVSLQDSPLSLVSANRILGSAGTAAIHVTGASEYAAVTNNVITDSLQSAILVSGTSNHTAIKGNTVVGASATTNSASNAIHLSSVDDCQVLSNTVRKNLAVANHAAAALFINSGCDRTWYILNDFRLGSNAATINDAGVSSVSTAGNL